MKKLLSFIQVAFIIGTIYIIGHIYDRLLHSHLVDLIGFSNLWITIFTIFSVFTIIPFIIFLFFKKKEPENKMFVLLAGFTSILPILFIIMALQVYTNPYLCDVPNSIKPLYSIIYKYILVSISIGILTIIIRHYISKWISIIIALLLVFVFDIIIRQGWIFVWLEYFGWMDYWLNLINR